ncbi:MAG: LysE family translocator [Polaromonas sp.]|nr:LysE family translocator [Polaromonas sp.]
MQLSNWLVFCGVSLVLCFTPGPAVLLAVSNSVAVGARRTVMSSLGNALGIFIISGIAMAGLGAVLAVSATAFMVLKVVGALYLIYLGVRQWRSTDNAFAATAAPLVGTANTRLEWRLFAQGLGVALTNPKSILFFSALFPQFLTPGASIFGQYLLLTGTFTVCALLSHAFYVVLVRVLKGQLASPARARLFNRVSGGMFILLGLSLLRLRNKAA